MSEDFYAASLVAPTCLVDGCAKRLHSRGMCQMHYARFRKHGTTDDSLARTYGPDVCTIEGCPGAHNARGYCNKHLKRYLKYGDPEGGRFHRRVVIGYAGMHLRIQRLNGRAAEHSCVDCGEVAAHWSYDHSDPNEVLSDAGYPYSTDLSRYAPRCASCHLRFDWPVARG